MSIQKQTEFLGIPLSTTLDDEAFLRTFEPENPALFVRKTLGVGWDLNVGALAVKLGLIRPDDSLGDLREYISPQVAKLLSAAPIAAAAAICSPPHLFREGDTLPPGGTGGEGHAVSPAGYEPPSPTRS